MASIEPARAPSVFDGGGFKSTIAAHLAEIRALYTEGNTPWIVGYSGGKDSTATLQLVWTAIAALEPHQRQKPIYVISTDTLVENPIVAAWVTRSLDTMLERARKDGLPFAPHRLTPDVADTFWVNLIGKGYPAPRPKFRWCTERLKIRPSNTFISNVARENGEAILVLGTRKAESQARARSMEKLEKLRVRDKLSPNAALPGCLVYSPIEAWSNDDVWLYLMQVKNPWGYNNKDLLTMYQGASPDGECPLVVDASTPSCGDSRFGCWVCTMVEQDRSMMAMIQNDEEKEWMTPLLVLRNELDNHDDRHLRDFRRINGLLQIHRGQLLHGPYKQETRAQWLRRLLSVERWVREHGPEHVRSIALISPAELHEIRRIWVVEKHEIEDLLPAIYQEATGEPYPGPPLEESPLFNAEDIALLDTVCDHDPLHFQLVRELLDVERRLRSSARRAGLYQDLEAALKRSFFTDEQDAETFALERHNAKEAVQRAREGDDPQINLFDLIDQHPARA